MMARAVHALPSICRQYLSVQVQYGNKFAPNSTINIIPSGAQLASSLAMLADAACSCAMPSKRSPLLLACPHSLQSAP